MEEENPDESVYIITYNYKDLEDGTLTGHSNHNYRGKSSVIYATKDR